MEDKTTELAASSSQDGLTIHKGKTDIFKISTASKGPVTLHMSELEKVEAFTYLGNIIDNNEDYYQESADLYQPLPENNPQDPLA